MFGLLGLGNESPPDGMVGAVRGFQYGPPVGKVVRARVGRAPFVSLGMPVLCPLVDGFKSS